MKSIIKIGNAGGFWGDDLGALRRQLQGGPLDYISTDYLAEITMSILRKQQMKNPELGYVADFVDQIVDVAALLKQKKTRIIVNAGGMNPLGCAQEICRRLQGSGNELTIAVVEGDNLLDDINELYPDKASFENMEDRRSYAEIKEQVQSANAYLGVAPLVKALESGAQVIIAGRVTDTSISIAPMVFEFGWKLDDWDKLASGLIAGHMMECGAQSTGGNFTDWKKVERWENFGYPITEVYPDGSFVLTKHPDTGGLVSVDTAKEQLLYEMGDPKNYISPDVVVDFTTIQLKDVGANRVKVFGVKGRPSTPFLKVSMAYNDGYKAKGSVIISGGEALEKARKFEEIFWNRLPVHFEKRNTEYVGYNSTHLDLTESTTANEVLLRFSVYDPDKDKIIQFGESIAPVILSGPPGVAVTGGRPRAQSVMTYWPTLVPKSEVKSVVKLLNLDGLVEKEWEIDSAFGFEATDFLVDSPKQVAQESGEKQEPEKQNFITVKFKDICLARSGDKGDMVNIGVIARSEPIYNFLKKHVTAEYIKTMFSSLCKGAVTRFELDNLQSLNFLLAESLDGGGTKSLMIDAQGKTFAAAFLNQHIAIPADLLP